MSRALLTFREAAIQLGWVDPDATEAQKDAAGRRLRDAIRRREREKRRSIATPLGHRTTKGRPQARVTLAAIYRHLPELRKTKADQLAEHFTAYIAEIEDRIGELAAAEIDRLVQPQINELHGKADKAQDVADQGQANAARALQKLKELERMLAKLTTKAAAKPPEGARTDGK